MISRGGRRRAAGGWPRDSCPACGTKMNGPSWGRPARTSPTAGSMPLPGHPAPSAWRCAPTPVGDGRQCRAGSRTAGPGGISPWIDVSRFPARGSRRTGHHRDPRAAFPRPSPRKDASAGIAFIDAVIGLALKVVMLLRRAGCLSDAAEHRGRGAATGRTACGQPQHRCRRHWQADVDSVSRITAMTSPQPTQDNVRFPCQGARLSIRVISRARFAHFPRLTSARLTRRDCTSPGHGSRGGSGLRCRRRMRRRPSRAPSSRTARTTPGTSRMPSRSPRHCWADSPSPFPPAARPGQRSRSTFSPAASPS